MSFFYSISPSASFPTQNNPEVLILCCLFFNKLRYSHFLPFHEWERKRYHKMRAFHWQFWSLETDMQLQRRQYLLLNLNLNNIYSHSSARSQIPNSWSTQGIWESLKVKVSAVGAPSEYKNWCLSDRFQAQPLYTVICEKIKCLNA